jgi:uncharacterized membrane protein
MEVWWVSPLLVLIGVGISIVLGARRDAKHSGVVDTLLEEHGRRITAQGAEIDELQDKMEDHVERITRVEVRCDTLRCDTLHARVIERD